MRALRWLEAVSGIPAGVMGGVAVAYLGLSPTCCTSACQATASGTATLALVDGRSAIIPLSAFAVVLLMISVGAA